MEGGSRKGGRDEEEWEEGMLDIMHAMIYLLECGSNARG